MSKDLRGKIFVFIVCLMIVFVAIYHYKRSVEYEKNGDYHYRCVGGVRYFYGSSIVLMRDVNDKPIPCN
jgi:hypothetical protein